MFDDKIPPDDSSNSIPEDEEKMRIEDIVGKDILTTGKKPTLRDVLLYQRVINYNMIIMYKNMIVMWELLKKVDAVVNKGAGAQDAVVAQIQAFLDAHKLIDDSDDPK